MNKLRFLMKEVSVCQKRPRSFKWLFKQPAGNMTASFNHKESYPIFFKNVVALKNLKKNVTFFTLIRF
jgi:hypothetical protein